MQPRDSTLDENHKEPQNKYIFGWFDILRGDIEAL